MTDVAQMVTPQKKETLVDIIHDRILEIVICEPVNEESVFTENKLVQTFGVSKATVREALVRLCNEGVLKSIPRYGYVVVQLKQSDVEDICQVRTMLELEALRISFDRIVECHLEELQACVACTAGQQEPSDIWKLWQNNIDFHVLLISFTGNSRLEKILRECMNVQTRIYAQSMWRKGKTRSQQVKYHSHESIYQALCERNLEKALLLLKNDIQTSFRSFD